MSPFADPGQHVFWLASRALGVVAIVLLAASVSFGLLLSGRVMRKPGAASRLRNMHEALALSATAAIAGHGLTLLGDKFLHPGLAGIALPFAMHNQPAWTGIGVIGGWLTAIFTFSFYVRRWIGTKTWRWLHRWTLAAYLLAVAHTIGSGTDAGSPWMMVMLVAISAPIVFGLSAKLLPESRRGPQAEPERRHAPQPVAERRRVAPREQPLPEGSAAL